MRCLIRRRRIRRNLEVLRGLLELDELELEEVLLEWALSNFLRLDFELLAPLFLAAKLCLFCVFPACFAHGCVHLERPEIEPAWQHGASSLQNMTA